MEEDILGTREEHESYGIISISRVSGSRETLFGSSISHNHFISLKIHRCIKHRSLNRDWYSDTRLPLIEVEMSNDQFAEMITTLNCGCGTPCTLKYVDGKEMKEPPYIARRKLFENEFKKKTSEITQRADKLNKDIKNILDDKVVSKTKLKETVRDLDNIIMQIKNNLPFTYDQFNEAMDKTVVEAKAEVEGFVNHAIHTAGVNAISSSNLTSNKSNVFEIETKREKQIGGPNDK